MIGDGDGDGGKGFWGGGGGGEEMWCGLRDLRWDEGVGKGMEIFVGKGLRGGGERTGDVVWLFGWFFGRMQIRCRYELCWEESLKARIKMWMMAR